MIKIILLVVFLFQIATSGINAQEESAFTLFRDSATSLNQSLGLNGYFYDRPGETNGEIVGFIISNLLPYLISFSGLILFAMLIMGGFEMLTAASDTKKADAGKTRITQAVIGFIIIFSAYWITQLVEIILGVNILR